jgi:hypothetical protein
VTFWAKLPCGKLLSAFQRTVETGIGKPEIRNSESKRGGNKSYWNQVYANHSNYSLKRPHSR